MVTSLNQSTPARESGYESVGYICVRIAPGSVNALLTKIGSIPAGACIIGISNRVNVAYAGGTPLLTIGSNATAYNNLNATLLEAQGSELVMPLAAFANPLTADTDFYANLTGGTPFTAGDGVIAILFIKPLA